ncbi:MAG TPA: hypothetical protein PLQ41_03120, partial [bacterium]|nr:hypothetical protein [bacterium]
MGEGASFLSPSSVPSPPREKERREKSLAPLCYFFFPRPYGERVWGEGDSRIFSPYSFTPTFILPHQRGRKSKNNS